MFTKANLKKVLCVAACSAAMSTSAQTVQLRFEDGTTASFLFSEKPELTFLRDSLCVRTSNTSLTIERSQLKGFDILEASNVESVTAASLAGEVYTVSGQKVQEGKGGIDWMQLPAGIYVIKTTTGRTIKIQKK